MTHEYLLWICVFAYALHIFEETMLDWKSWAASTFGKKFEWPDFFVANAAVIVGGVCTAMVGWQAPSFALLLPALQWINGLFFHIIPSLIQKRISPGVVTACVLFLPISTYTYVGAWKDHVLTWDVFILSFIFGALVMASPFIFLKYRLYLKEKR